MVVTISKAKLKPKLLEFLRAVEVHKHELLITDRGRPVARVIPFVADAEEAFRPLRGSVLSYDRPCDPVAEDDWEATR
jgi:prevent-host-death family protein